MPRVKLCVRRGCPRYAAEGRNHCGICAEKYRPPHPTPAAIDRSKIYNTARWRRTAALVKYRDDYTCQHCGYRGYPKDNWLVADHRRGVLEVDDPFDPDECQTLCRRCSGEKDGGRASANEANP